MANTFDDPFSDNKDSYGEKLSPRCNSKESCEKIRSVDEIVHILKEKKLLEDSFGEGNDKYIVKTSIKQNKSGASYHSYVTLNKEELSLDDVLGCRESKYDDLENCIKEAAKQHCIKCCEIRRIKKEVKYKQKKALIIKSLLLSVFIIMGSGIYMYFHPVDSKVVQYGYINIVTTPWTEIYIDGESHGFIPIKALKIRAGNVKIRFVNKVEGIDETEIFYLRPNEVTPIRKHEWKNK